MVIPSQPPQYSFEVYQNLFEACYLKTAHGDELLSRSLEGFKVVDSKHFGLFGLKLWKVTIYVEESTNKLIAVVRGSDNPPNFLAACMNHFWEPSGLIKDMESFVSSVEKKLGVMVSSFGGHSEGGFFALRMFVNRLVERVTLNAHKALNGLFNYNFCFEHEFVSKFPISDRGRYILIKAKIGKFVPYFFNHSISNGKSLKGMSWQVLTDEWNSFAERANNSSPQQIQATSASVVGDEYILKSDCPKPKYRTPAELRRAVKERILEEELARFARDNPKKCTKNGIPIKKWKRIKFQKRAELKVDQDPEYLAELEKFNEINRIEQEVKTGKLQVVDELPNREIDPAKDETFKLDKKDEIIPDEQDSIDNEAVVETKKGEESECPEDSIPEEGVLAEVPLEKAKSVGYFDGVLVGGGKAFASAVIVNSAVLGLINYLKKPRARIPMQIAMPNVVKGAAESGTVTAVAVFAKNLLVNGGVLVGNGFVSSSIMVYYLGKTALSLLNGGNRLDTRPVNLSERTINALIPKPRLTPSSFGHYTEYYLKKREKERKFGMENPNLLV